MRLLALTVFKVLDGASIVGQPRQDAVGVAMPRKSATRDPIRYFLQVVHAVVIRPLRTTAHVLAVLLSEYWRAVAVERRYEELRRAAPFSLTSDGNKRADITRRIFGEFYSRVDGGFGRHFSTPCG